MGAFLPLGLCKDAKISTQIYNPLNFSLLTTNFQAKSKSVLEDNYNPFNPNSNFYNDICTPFTNEEGKDVLLFYRRNHYFNNEYNLCEEGCDFIGYNETINMFTCNCSIKKSVNDKSTYKVTPMVVPDEFYKKKEEYSNIKVFKCASQVFSLKGQKLNFGSYILMACFTSFIGVVVFYFLKGKKRLDNKYDELNQVRNDNNKITANPPKNDGATDDEEVNKNKEGYGVFVKPGEQNPDNIQKDFVLNDEDLNSVDYDTAKKCDTRTFWKYYLSLIKLKQLIVFTFYTYTDHNLREVKIALFILFLSFYFAFTALFFNDDIMRDIYLYKGNPIAAIHITNVILSSLCSLIMNLIVRFISLSERDIHKAMEETNPDRRKALLEGIKRKQKNKLIVVFSVSAFLIALCWYYVAAFCAVFKNSQGNYLVNVFWTFIICNLWPCVTSLIAPIFRIKSLKGENSKCMYKLSQIIAYF